MTEKEELKELIKNRAVKIGEFKLSSGGTSNFYIDCKQITLHHRGTFLMGKAFVESFKGLGLAAVGGPTLGADPMVSAIALVSDSSPNPINAFIVRKEPKKHGTQQWVEGILKPGDKVAVLDDVVTKATSILKAINRVEELGCEIVRVTCLVDREEGGAEALAKYDFQPLFKKSDFV